MVQKNCKSCKISLNSENRAGKRLLCKSCRSREVVEWGRKNCEKRKIRVNTWVRKTGRVKEYPCEVCFNPCYKKYAKAFCSDKCRFLSYVQKTETCWIWKASRNRGGYGKTSLRGNSNVTAHRTSFELFKFKEPIPEGMQVLHRCDTPSCVNPDHLWLGTTQQNKKDQIEKDRIGKKLKASDVIDIRKLYDEGMGSQTIANLYKVDCSTISNIAKRRTWKHL